METKTAQAPQTFDGYLFSKLAAIGTRSEDTHYYLQGFDNSDTPIHKNTPKFQDDPNLRAHLGTKVAVVGSLNGKVLSYTSIGKYSVSASAAAG